MSGILSSRWRLSLFIVAAYLASGFPALSLAESSGYGSPVFPPAGIAVAFCFALGLETLPAVFVGAFLLNFWIGFSKTFHAGEVEIASGLFIAVASTLQAGVGAWALRRFVGHPAPLDRMADLARFLVVVPVACLTSSTLSTLFLYRLGAISAQMLPSGWGAWWLGDTLGVVTVFPIVMVAFGEPRILWRKRALTVALPMVVVFAMFVAVFLRTSDWEKGQALSKFRLESQKAGEGVKASLNAHGALLRAVRALMAGGKTVDRAEFGRFCEDILSRYPAIRSLEWVAASGDGHYPITYVEPLAGNETLQGFDLMSQPELRQTVLRAVSSGRLIATPPVKFARHRKAGMEVQLMLGVKGRGGVVIAVIGMGNLMSGVVDASHSDIYAKLVDLDSGSPLYDTFPRDATVPSRYGFEFGGRRYVLETAPTAAYLDRHRAWQSWAVLLSGIFGTGILGAFLLLGTGYAARIEREVGERTGELRLSEFRYHQMFETNAAVKLVIDPETGNIIDANKAAEQFYGYSRAELLSMGIDAINHLPREKIAPEMQKAVAEKQRCFNFRHRLASGEIRDVEVYTGPVEMNGKKFLYSIVHDITDRKRTEESLRLFTSVFEASSEAVMVVDRASRIVAVNPAFTRITGYSQDEVKGENPRIMSSGRHDNVFYQEMWHALGTVGHWQGEIWDKRKNGEIFPEWLTINTIYDEAGDVRERVAIFSDISKKKEAEVQVWRQANFDALTGLPNRNMFRDRLEIEIRKASRSGFAFALFFIDLDRFKEVNDTLGHEAGDKLLVEAAHRIAAAVRESDTVARLGGDEFTVILSDLPGNAHVENVASAIIHKLAEPFTLGDELAYISGSIGITLYPSDALNAPELIKNADQAMYVAKALGKNRFAYFTPALQDAAVERMKLIGELRNAIANGEFRLVFQPIIELATGGIVKAEALLRWTNPRRGAVSPMEFIPLAEETGLIHEIGDWVFREAARWALRWRGYRDDFQVSLNSSPVQLMVQPSGQSWLDYLGEIGLSGKAIIVEITEGVLLNATDAVVDRLIGFRDAGIQVAIDDFGTGYSALAYLKKFDIDYLKIDKSFISGIEQNPDDLTLSRAIVAMAHSLALKVVAEGVETAGQSEILAAIGCDHVQGYFYARPLPPEELEKLLAASGAGSAASSGQT